MTKIQRRLLIQVFLFAVLFVFSCGSIFSIAAAADLNSRPDELIFGITVDDSWYGEVAIAEITAAIRAMPVRPVVRIVMTDDLPVAEYVELFSAISSVATVMAQPVDSFYMRNYPDVESYLERFRESFQVLSPYVGIWEIGNEINGVDWIRQDPALIVAKTRAANDFIRARGGKTALTVYYADPADHDLFDWLDRYLPVRLAENVDYALVSYYEDDNGGYAPDWASVFAGIARFFPNAKIGVGESGNTAADRAAVESKIAMATAYYGMRRAGDRFIGGYFWWNWVQDCIPHPENPVFNAINSAIAEAIAADLR